MKYKCLVFDHDDTAVNSTATIHHPSFVEYAKDYGFDIKCSFEDYVLGCFRYGCPGFFYHMGLTSGDMEVEEVYWKNYVSTRIPQAYPGIKEIMDEQRRNGGFIAVCSHSMEENILRDYEYNNLPAPDLVYGWGRPEEQRKPYPFPLIDIMGKLGLEKQDILMIDDLKPGFDMAKNVGVDFAAASWAYDIPEIADFMRNNCTYFFNTVDALKSFLFQ